MKKNSKMAEHPENGVQMVVFLTEIDFSSVKVFEFSCEKEVLQLLIQITK